MKIAYLAQIGLYENNGVVIKIKNQVESWLSMNHEVQLVILTSGSETSLNDTAFAELEHKGCIKLFNIQSSKGLPIDVIKDWLGIASTFTKANNFIDNFAPDIVYARYGFYQPFYSKLGKKYKIIFEVNTDFDSEYSLVKSKSVKRFLKYQYYKLTKPFFLKGVSGIAAVTNEIGAKYKGLPVEVFPNSIKVSNYVYQSLKSSQKIPSIVFMGSPGMAWHGVDLLVKLAEELPEIRFDVIGYKKINTQSIPSNVHLHGFLKKEEYIKIITRSTAAIGTLALFRNKMEEACPLKVREYMACHKPLILPYKETAFEVSEYPKWVLQVDFQKETMNQIANKVQGFLSECLKISISKEDVFKYIDVSVIEERRVLFFDKVLKNIF